MKVYHRETWSFWLQSAHHRRQLFSGNMMFRKRTKHKQSSHCKKAIAFEKGRFARHAGSSFFFERGSLSYRKGWFPIERGWFDCHEDQITRHRCDHFSSLKGRVGLLHKGRVSHRKGWFDCHWDQVTRTEVFVKTPVSIVGKTSKTSLSMSVTAT